MLSIRNATAACSAAILLGILLAPALAAGESPSREAATVMETLLDEETPRAERKALADRLVALGPPAVDAVMARWSFKTVDRPTADLLVGALGRIDSPEALRALERILLVSTLRPASLPDPVALAGALVEAREGEEGVSPARARVASLLLPGEVERLRAIAEKEPDEAAPADAYAVARILNRLLALKTFYDAEAFRALRLSEEGRILLSRHDPDAETMRRGLPPRELARFNRILLEAIFPDGIRPGPASLDPRVYRSLGASAALKALARMDLPEARELLLTYEAQGMEELVHIRALGAMEEAEADEALFTYLFRHDPGAGTRARRFLEPRFADDPPRARRLLAGGIRRIEAELRRAPPELEHIYHNLMALVLALPAREAEPLAAEALASDAPGLRDAAVDAIEERPALLRSPEVLDALAWQMPNADETTALRILALLQRGGFRNGVRVAVLGLDHPRETVIRRAMQTLGALTGEDPGASPAAWRRWAARRTKD